MTTFCGRFVGFALLLVGFGLPSAQANDLRPALKDLAGDLKTFLTSRNESAVGVGAFTGPPSTSAGSGVAQILGEELKKLELQVRPGAKLGVKGEYSFAEAPADNGKGTLLVAKIRVSVVDKLGNTVLELPLERTVTSEADIAQLAGAPVVMPNDVRATVKERDQEIRKAIADPQTKVEGTRIAAGEKFAIEILVDGQACPPKVEDGLAFVPIPRDSTYAVKLINHSDHEAGVRLTIDGLSPFAFSEVRHTSGPRQGEPLYNVFLIKPGKELIVKGWHISNTRSDQFVVSEFAKSAAAELKSGDGVGTITATFAAAWEGKLPPADEPAQNRSGGGDATGRGKPVDAKFKEAKRTIGAVRASVSVRYTK